MLGGRRYTERNLVVAAGVIAGILLAVWFSTIVAASGKPAGSVYRDQDYHQRQTKERETREWLFGLKNYPPRQAYEPACNDDSKRDECFMSWRSARAAEVQAKAAVDQVYWSKAAFWFLVFTFGATALAAYFAYKAAVATNKGAVADQASADTADETLKAMEATAERQLRAYVLVSKPKLASFGEGSKPEAIVPFKNFGQTPARKVTAWAGIMFAEAPLSPFPKVDAPDALSRSTLGPGADLQVTHKEAEKALSRADFNKIVNGDAVLYVLGRIDYLDAFDKPRFTSFRLMFNRDAAKRGDGSLSVCPDGNDSD